MEAISGDYESLLAVDRVYRYVKYNVPRGEISQIDGMTRCEFGPVCEEMRYQVFIN